MSKLTRPSLLDQARAGAILPGPKCDIVKALDANPSLRDEIIELMRAHDVGHSPAARILTDATGVDIATDTVGRHRRGQCVNCRKAGYVW